MGIDKVDDLIKIAEKITHLMLENNLSYLQQALVLKACETNLNCCIINSFK